MARSRQAQANSCFELVCIFYPSGGRAVAREVFLRALRQYCVLSRYVGACLMAIGEVVRSAGPLSGRRFRAAGREA